MPDFSSTNIILPMSRRRFLRLAGGLALSPYQPIPVIRRLEKTEIILALQPYQFDAISQVLPDFESQSGMKVTLTAAPASGVAQYNQLEPLFRARTSPFDLGTFSDESGSRFMRSGYLEPLNHILPEQTLQDFLPIFKPLLKTWNSVDDVLYRVPHDFSMSYFFYRKDKLDAASLKVPTSWAEIIATGKQVTMGKTWATRDALGKDGLMFVYVSYLAVQAGGSIFELDDAAVSALQFLYDMIHVHRVFPPDAFDDTYDRQNTEYLEDRVIFMRQWPYFFGVAQQSTRYSPEKIAVALPPAGAAGSKSWVGGWGFAVPVAARNKAGALELLRYLTSPAIAPRLAMHEPSFLIPRGSILQAMSHSSTPQNPLLSALQMYVDAEVPTPRPYHPRLSEAQTVIDNLALRYLSKQQSLAPALRQAHDELAQLK